MNLICFIGLDAKSSDVDIIDCSGYPRGSVSTQNQSPLGSRTNTSTSVQLRQPPLLSSKPDWSAK